MRTREEIEDTKIWDEDYQNWFLTKNLKTEARIIIEVLLDIRDLLSKQSNP